MERNAFLINKKIHQYILPGVLMTVAMQLGNVVDGMIVGNLLGAEAMAAIEISMPALAEPYIMVNVAGIPILTTAIIFCYFMNADNHPQLGSALFIIANAVNLVLDFVFIRRFHMGMAGSALATVIGYLAGMAPVLIYFRAKQRMLRLRRPDKKAFHYMRIAMKAGIPSAAFTLMSAMKSVMINSAIVRILGNGPMAVYSVCANAVLIAELCVGGIIGLVQNIAGILYGERDYYGIRTLCKRALSYSYIAIVILLLIFFAVPGWIAGLFGITESSMLTLCETALRIFACSFPFYVYNKFLMSYYQTILQPGLSTVVTVLQGFAVIVPLTLAGIYFWGLPGVCLMAVVSEAVTILLAFLWRIMGQRSGKYETGGVYMLPQITNEKFLDCSVKSNLKEVIAFREKLLACCADNHISERDATILGLAVEEISANIVQYGYRSGKNYMDISFTIQDDKYMLRIRDDGIPFNPLEYQQQKEEAVALGGIALIKKMASEFQYMRVLNMNNTVVELNIRKN